MSQQSEVRDQEKLLLMTGNSAKQNVKLFVTCMGPQALQLLNEGENTLDDPVVPGSSVLFFSTDVRIFATVQDRKGICRFSVEIL